MAASQLQSRVASEADIEARLEVLEARVVELESRVAIGTASDAEREELMRAQAEADFCLEWLDDMGAFNPSC